MNFVFGHYRKNELFARCIWEWKVKVLIWTYYMTYPEILKRNLVLLKSQERSLPKLGCPRTIPKVLVKCPLRGHANINDSGCGRQLVLSTI